MKKTGIWLDKRMAYIISIDGDEVQSVKTVFSKIEDYHIHGGSGTRLKGGPQDVVQDSKYLEREKHQFKVYFKSIAHHLEDTDEIVLFGPAEAREKLVKEWLTSNRKLHSRVKGVVRTDSMTKNQMKAFVRKYFGQRQAGIRD